MNKKEIKLELERVIHKGAVYWMTQEDYFNLIKKLEGEKNGKL